MPFEPFKGLGGMRAARVPVGTLVVLNLWRMQ
jgi:hypothetical protein